MQIRVKYHIKKKLFIVFLLIIAKKNFCSTRNALPQNYNNGMNITGITSNNINANGFSANPNFATPNAQAVGIQKNTPNSHPYQVMESNYTWQNQTQIDSLNAPVDANINWQERKILKQKMNLVYSKILTNNDDCKMVIEKFDNKINDFNKLYHDCITEITKKIQQYYPQLGMDQIQNILQNLLNRYNTLKSSTLYNQNKDFEQKIDDTQYTFTNLESMLTHGQSSLQEFQSYIAQVIASISNLSQITKEIDTYENTAWQMYQKIDELISEYDAQNNSNIINNSLSNVESLNYYLRNDFLSYINESINNADNTIDAIINLYNNIIINIKATEKTISEFEYEINQAMLIEEQKKAEAIEKQKKDEENQRLYEEKKKKEQLLRQEASKTIFDKTINFLNNAWQSITALVEQIKNSIFQNNNIKKIISFLPKKSNTKIDKKEEKGNIKALDNVIVDKKIENYIAPNEEPIQQEMFSILPQKIPNIEKIMPIDQLNQPEIVVSANNKNIDNNQNIMMEDVFHNEKPHANYPQEHIDGAASYPVDIIPQIGMLTPEEMQAENQLLPFGYDSSQEMPATIDQNNNSDQDQDMPHANNNYHYTSLEINRDDNADNDRSALLPDLSSLINITTPIQIGGRNGTETQTQYIQNSNQSFTPNVIHSNTLETREQRNPTQKNKKANKKKKKKKNIYNTSSKNNTHVSK